MVAVCGLCESMCVGVGAFSVVVIWYGAFAYAYVYTCACIVAWDYIGQRWARQAVMGAPGIRA